jgi:hypothetical protein
MDISSDDQLFQWMVYNLDTFGTAATVKKLEGFLQSFIIDDNENGQRNVLALITALNEEMDVQAN